MAVLSKLSRFQRLSMIQSALLLTQNERTEHVQGFDHLEHHPMLAPPPIATLPPTDGNVFSIDHSHCYGTTLSTIRTEAGAVFGPYDSHEQPRARGPKKPETVVWFCSECGDGPILDWQTACPQCYHQRCGSCKEEYAS
ncbi:hypothetical protein EK21DRAFT_90046 [Setomelanomma holmii]|uniref:Uncharacterized protein n=1 Tax=Setomelanomma holmii TaxID=210430 RepID=A0A9P4H9P1_9PLEO|nr:hypothetical protein EK21DRAFT_90046 [Setomelanomma holmii]